jgi:hypothetical protein
MPGGSCRLARGLSTTSELLELVKAEAEEERAWAQRNAIRHRRLLTPPPPATSPRWRRAHSFPPTLESYLQVSIVEDACELRNAYAADAYLRVSSLAMYAHSRGRGLTLRAIPCCCASPRTF